VRAERSNETSADIARAFTYAADNGARIANASLAETEYSQELADAIAAHPQTLFVVAAGNNGQDLDQPGNLSYPCEYDAPNVLCVAATGRRDELAGFSNFSATSVDLGAPGTITSSSQPAYTVVSRDSFETDPFDSRWVRGARAGDVNAWGLSTQHAASGTRSVTSGAAAADSDSWIESAQPLDLRGRMGCDLQTFTWLDAPPAGAGLYVQARADRAFEPASTVPSQDTARPAGDTVGYFTGAVDAVRKTVNISDLDGSPSVYLRYGILAGAGATARAWLDDVQVRCLGGGYSADGVADLRYEQGTSMAAPHVAATAALIIASGVIGADPKPAAVLARLQATARDLGAPGKDPLYGAGLLNAAAATAAAP
jgi:subtilisin family serine protease